MRIVLQMIVVAIALSIVYPLLHRLTAPYVTHVEVVADYLKIYGEIYGVIVAFIIFVVWGQYANTEAALDKEVSNLEALITQVGFLEPRLEEQKNDCRRLVTRYALLVADDEFKTLAKGEESKSAETAFHNLLQHLHGMRMRIQSPQDLETYSKIQDIVSQAIRLRDDRVTISSTRMPITLKRLLQFLSVILVGCSTFLQTHDQFISYLLFLMLAMICAVLLAVVYDMDNPFSGVWNLSDQPLRILAGKQKQQIKISA
jgi:hypothetical protein